MHRSKSVRTARLGFSFAAALGLVLLAAAPSQAQSQVASDALAELRLEMARMRADYEQRLAALEAKLEALERTSAQLPPIQPAPPPAAAGGPAQTSNYFNPAMSVIGNFLVFAGHNDFEESPAANLEESEVGLQAIIDPYARADVFISLGDEGAEVEEGFVTFTSLPANLLAKVGRMKVTFGKVNGLHPHVLPWADKPLPIVNLLGGEEGWIGNGVSLARLIPLGETFSELTLQVFDGDAEGLFEAEQKSDLAYNAHFRLFRDLSDASNLELGLSYGRGPHGVLADSELAGVDFMYRWKPLRSGNYRSFVLRGEYLANRAEAEEVGRQTATGWYVSADYQLARRWWIGGRYDYSERALDADLHDDGEALMLTFSPSEYMKLRGQLRHRLFAEDVSATELLLQLQFAIGAHGAHPF
jgi:hypothetical protein